MAANFDGGTAGDRYQVVLHVNTEAADADSVAPPTPNIGHGVFDGALEVDHGALYVSYETLFFALL